MSRIRWALVALLAATLAASLALPAYADTVTLGRRVTLIDRVAGVPTAGRVACRAEGYQTGDSLQGHIACEEYQGAKRLRNYYRWLKVWRGSWVIASRDDTDIVAQQTKATLSGSTPQVSLCQVNTTGRRIYQVQSSTAVRWDNDTVTTRTFWSDKFEAPLLVGDPLCKPPAPAARLALAASHNPPSPLNGEPFTVVFAAGNNGTATANGAQFTVNLPDAWTGVTADAGAGTSCAVAAGNVVTCDLGALSAGEEALVSIHVADANGAAAVSLTGTLSSTTSGVANATTTETFTIRPAANVSVVKSFTGGPVADLDSNFNYVLTVHNAGPNTATAITVRDTWPAGLDDPSLPAGCIFINPDATNSGEVVECDVVSLTPGADAVITIGARTNGEASGDLTNTVTAFGDQADPNEANNTDTLTVPVTA